jgi:periplasmic divalent cation tolerance protein
MRIAKITTTFGKRGEADEILRRLIEERLAACAHLERVSSSYNWNGVERSDDEWRVTFKTTIEMRDQALDRLEELHSYDVPMILWSEEETTDAYGAWMETQLVEPEDTDEYVP